MNHKPRIGSNLDAGLDSSKYYILIQTERMWDAGAVLGMIYLLIRACRREIMI